MSYMGYTPLMSKYCQTIHEYLRSCNIERPVNILEIGVDTGQTTIPLIQNLTNLGVDFIWMGVDVRHDPTFSQQINLFRGVDHYQLKASETRSRCIYRIENSLDFLRRNGDVVYDLVLIDGDHNYDTVIEELSYLNSMTHDLSMVIIDDYGGKHASVDNWYSDKETHANLEHISRHLDKTTNKGGVKGAVDEFLESNNMWNYQTISIFPEPIVLTRKIGWVLQGPREEDSFFEELDGSKFYPTTDKTYDKITIGAIVTEKDEQ